MSVPSKVIVPLSCGGKSVNDPVSQKQGQIYNQEDHSCTSRRAETSVPVQGSAPLAGGADQNAHLSFFVHGLFPRHEKQPADNQQSDGHPDNEYANQPRYLLQAAEHSRLTPSGEYQCPPIESYNEEKMRIPAEMR